MPPSKLLVSSCHAMTYFSLKSLLSPERWHTTSYHMQQNFYSQMFRELTWHNQYTAELLMIGIVPYLLASKMHLLTAVSPASLLLSTKQPYYSQLGSRTCLHVWDQVLYASIKLTLTHNCFISSLKALYMAAKLLKSGICTEFADSITYICMKRRPDEMLLLKGCYGLADLPCPGSFP